MAERLTAKLIDVALGAKDSFALVLAVMPFGLVFGALGHAHGFSDWVVVAISIFVFAGASQFIAITMLAAGAIVPVIILTVFVVNLRHMLYAVSLIPVIRHVPQRVRIPMAFLLTDETFAVVFNKASHSEAKQNLSRYYFGSALFMYLSWVSFTWLGVVAGGQFPALTEFGLDIAMVVAFIGIVVPNLKLRSHWACAFTATVSGLLSYDWPHQTGLLFSSLFAISVGVFIENRLSKQQLTLAGNTTNE